MILAMLPTPAPLGQPPGISAPVLYPANADAHRALLAPAAIEEKLGLRGPQTPLHLVSIALQRWSAAHGATTQMAAVAPNRLVYRVVTSFDTPYSAGGNTWSAGRSTFFVDAETGDVLLGTTTGNLIRSALVHPRARAGGGSG